MSVIESFIYILLFTVLICELLYTYDVDLQIHSGKKFFNPNIDRQRRIDFNFFLRKSLINLHHILNGRFKIILDFGFI